MISLYQALYSVLYIHSLSFLHTETVRYTIVSTSQVKKLRLKDVKQLAQSLTALGGSPGSETQRYDPRAMLLTTSLHDPWGMGLSSLCLALLYTVGLYKCQFSALPGSSMARCGSSMQPFNNFQITYCVLSYVPSGSYKLEPNQL